MPVHAPEVLWTVNGETEGARGIGVACPALISIVEKVIGGRVHCLTHIAIGGFHNIILVDFEDNREAVVRIVRLDMVPFVRPDGMAAGRAWYVEKMDRESSLLGYLGIHTSIPVPLVMHTSPDEGVGLSWMLMTKSQGRPIDHVYAGLTKETKAKLIAQMARARHTVELFQLNLPSGVGTLCPYSVAAEVPLLSPPVSSLPGKGQTKRAVLGRNSCGCGVPDTDMVL